MDVPAETWLSAHLYYAPPWEEILVQAIQPFVEAILAKQWANQFFFIRYWERGPHIRLRFKGKTNVLEQIAKPELARVFISYCDQKPSQRQKPESDAEDLLRRGWYPNNTIRYIKYEPEIERYGGAAGILIAEKQFHASSKTVLSVLSTCGDWDYERVLGTAIQMHVSLAFALGMSVREAAQFYSYVLQCWLSNVLAEPISPAEELGPQQNETLKAFEEKFIKQSSVLIPFHKTLWRALEDKVSFGQVWLGYWLNQLSIINSDLRHAQESKALTYNKPDAGYSPMVASAKFQSLWPILESYVHMTNNRLGVSNLDEAYLGYLISRSLTNL